ncbi:MerR family DNA-binding transcriptional regulator [Paracoccus sp. p4-l81]|uniref:MerR family transcriptional regulator n=1 Tax=unclassified Paracoccus (in: a-proteobacteria) TaxID=2688777 RepID=UPI0035B7F19E
MSDDLMTIRQMCDAFDVTARTLRFYEARELLAPIRQGQKRLYTRRDRGRLTLILRGKRFGFSLEEIRQLLDLYEPGEGSRDQIARTADAARARLGILTAQQAELTTAIDELRGEIARLDTMLAGQQA